MRQDWEPEDLIEVWTLLEDDMKKVRNKSGATRLGFALPAPTMRRRPRCGSLGPSTAVRMCWPFPAPGTRRTWQRTSPQESCA